MRASELELFVCAECGTGMECVQSVPVLESLRGHAIHRCGECGHILLVQEHRAPEWSAGWLSPLFMNCRPAITCVGVV